MELFRLNNEVMRPKEAFAQTCQFWNLKILQHIMMLMFYTVNEHFSLWMMRLVNVSYILAAVDAVGVRDLLYLGHRIWKAKSFSLLLLHYPSLIWNKFPFYCWVNRDNFPVSDGQVRVRIHDVPGSLRAITELLLPLAHGASLWRWHT